MATSTFNYQELAEKIKLWGQELGFAQVGIADIDLAEHEEKLTQWLNNQYHGDMDYMSRHGLMRARPAELMPETIRVISVKMNYLPNQAKFADTLANKNTAYISRYALGRDYHKLMRKRLKQLGDKIINECANANLRPFVDSAPVLERPLAEKAGLGWVGKHSLLLSEDSGSWYFLGEILIDLPLPCDKPKTNQCGSCVACIKICPTNAIVEPYVVDARKCISYLTIEHKEAIPIQYRQAIGNRIYGCDDCQLICPWNQYAQLTVEQDFQARHQLDKTDLLTLFHWSEKEFLSKTEGSAIRRIGHQQWLRNIAIALGNCDYHPDISKALLHRKPSVNDLVQEHIDWALAQQQEKAQQQNIDNHSPSARLNGRLIRSIRKGLPRDA
ncbi:tRNA epoxyqueuosine(34) reductase QueG [Thalassotalea ganghwensis]